MSESKELAPVVPLDLEVFNRAEAIAGKLAKSALLPSAVRGKPADLAVIMITGHELGLSPMQSLRGLHVVEGRPVLAAELIVGLVKKHPACRYFRLVRSDDEVAIYETQRKGEPEPTRLTWTIQQARNAGLAGAKRDNWNRHPAAMLRARCSAALARAVYPDIVMGIYDPDEAQDVREGLVIEAQTVAPPPPAEEAKPKATAKRKAEASVEEAAPIEDAELVAPETGEVFTSDEDPVQVWSERIAGTPDLEALGQLRAALMREHPDKDDPVRVALRDTYSARERELRRAEQ